MNRPVCLSRWSKATGFRESCGEPGSDLLSQVCSVSEADAVRRKPRLQCATVSHVLRHRRRLVAESFGLRAVRFRQVSCARDGMSRPLRLHVPGLLHHVFARGNEKSLHLHRRSGPRIISRPARPDPSSIRRALRSICSSGTTTTFYSSRMRIPLSRLLQQLNSTYCQRFNRRHRRVGHVLQGRYGCRIVEDGAYARTVLRYLALNPVVAEKAARPEDYTWSSYRFALGLEEPPDFLSLRDVWSAFGTSDSSVGRARLAQFVAAGLQDAFTNPLLHGSARLAERLGADLEPHRATRDYVYPARFADRPSLGSLLDGCVDREAIEDAAHTAFHRHAYTLAEIAAALGRDPSVICRWIQHAKLRRSVNPQRCPPLMTSLQKQDLTPSDPNQRGPIGEGRHILTLSNRPPLPAPFDIAAPLPPSVEPPRSKRSRASQGSGP